jgi:cyclic pyranopterin phosphate synthase
MHSDTLVKIRDQQIAKGDVLATARIAGIMAAKQTAGLIPLCHPLGLDSITIEFELQESAIAISTTVKVSARTGVEMEALVSASVAALTIYDMCKSLDRGMTIDAIRLEEKSGGASGHYLRKERDR